MRLALAGQSRPLRAHSHVAFALGPLYQGRIDGVIGLGTIADDSGARLAYDLKVGEVQSAAARLINDATSIPHSRSSREKEYPLASLKVSNLARSIEHSVMGQPGHPPRLKTRLARQRCGLAVGNRPATRALRTWAPGERLSRLVAVLPCGEGRNVFFRAVACNLQEFPGVVIFI